jgi:hypothetical protein
MRCAKKSPCDAFPRPLKGSINQLSIAMMKTVEATQLFNISQSFMAKSVVCLGLFLVCFLAMGTTTLHAQSESSTPDGIGIVITEDINRVASYTVSGLPKDWTALVVGCAATGVVVDYIGNGTTLVEIDLSEMPDGVYAVTVILGTKTVHLQLKKGD